MKNTVELIENNVKDLVSELLYYSRKEDEDLQINDIENAVKDGLISAEEIVTIFKRELEANL